MGDYINVNPKLNDADKLLFSKIDEMISASKKNNISLLDYFAGKALEGMLAHSRNGHGYQPREKEEIDWHVSIANEAYEIANAMMEQKDKAKNR